MKLVWSQNSTNSMAVGTQSIRKNRGEDRKWLTYAGVEEEAATKGTLSQHDEHMTIVLDLSISS
jgi:hypothetical protein